MNRDQLTKLFPELKDYLEEYTMNDFNLSWYPSGGTDFKNIALLEMTDPEFRNNSVIIFSDKYVPKSIDRKSPYMDLNEFADEDFSFSLLSQNIPIHIPDYTSVSEGLIRLLELGLAPNPIKDTTLDYQNIRIGKSNLGTVIIFEGDNDEVLRRLNEQQVKLHALMLRRSMWDADFTNKKIKINNIYDCSHSNIILPINGDIEYENFIWSSTSYDFQENGKLYRLRK